MASAIAKHEPVCIGRGHVRVGRQHAEDGRGGWRPRYLKARIRMVRTANPVTAMMMSVTCESFSSPAARSASTPRIFDSTNNQWRHGVLLEDPDYDSACLMEADPERSSVLVTVRGPNPSYFFGVMNRTFADTLKRYPGLQYTAYIPCPCGGRAGETECRHEWSTRIPQ
jgi:hypothetical protein